MYKVLYIPGSCLGFLPSTVLIKSHINYYHSIRLYCLEGPSLIFVPNSRTSWNQKSSPTKCCELSKVFPAVPSWHLFGGGKTRPSFYKMCYGLGSPLFPSSRDDHPQHKEFRPWLICCWIITSSPQHSFQRFKAFRPFSHCPRAVGSKGLAEFARTTWSHSIAS